ncbi:unnamed protein product, partial [Ectocarpus sp. 12 AP-2014]
MTASIPRPGADTRLPGTSRRSPLSRGNSPCWASCKRLRELPRGTVPRPPGRRPRCSSAPRPRTRAQRLRRRREREPWVTAPKLVPARLLRRRGIRRTE